jgi:MFS family permease
VALRYRSLLYAAGGVRSFVIGFTGVALGLYLAARGHDPALVGGVVASGLAGNAAGVALVAGLGERLGRRRLLVAASVLSAVGLAALAATPAIPSVVGLAAFFGMVNGMGRDRGPAQALEQSLLADVLDDARRTGAFTRYTFVQDVVGACGSLAAALPTVLEHRLGLALTDAYRVTLTGAALVSLVPVLLYVRLPAAVGRASAASHPRRLSPESRRRVAGLSALFALDSLGGGFIAGSILSYWFFRRFGLGGEALGPVFFAARCLNAGSYFAAAALARRLGLVRTMVFTHLPTSFILLALPFVPTASLAVALFLAREALVQMDVPARQSYVAAVTAPGERTTALAVTSLVRNVGWAAGPGLAGATMAAFGLGAPLVCGAALKAVYDVALFLSYRGIRPPGESS